MRLDTPISLLLLALGLLTGLGGLGLIAGSLAFGGAIEGAIAEAAEGLTYAERGAERLDGGLTAALGLLPQIEETLDRSAVITRQAQTVLAETGEAGAEVVEALRLTGRDLATMASQLRILGNAGQLRETSAQMKVSADALEEALAQVATLQKQVGELAPQMQTIARSVDVVGQRVEPAKTVLPEIRARLGSLSAAFDAPQITRWVQLATQIIGGLFCLVGLGLWGIGSTRMRLSRAARARA